jgi:hypothetical protein
VDPITFIGEMSQLTGITEGALRRLCIRGKVRCRTIGAGTRVFNRGDAEEIRQIALREGLKVYERTNGNILQPMALNSPRASTMPNTTSARPRSSQRSTKYPSKAITPLDVVLSRLAASESARVAEWARKLIAEDDRLKIEPGQDAK